MHVTLKVKVYKIAPLTAAVTGSILLRTQNHPMISASKILHLAHPSKHHKH